MGSYSEVIDGMGESCIDFTTLVVSGNVSFYNETEGRGVLPTPVIGMVGLIEDVKRVIQPGFKEAGDLIALLGVTGDDLSLSQYANSVRSPTVREGNVALAEAPATDIRVPALDLELELAVQAACLRAAEAGLLRSAHDCSDGGLAVALAECCFSSLNRKAIGAAVDISGDFDLSTRLFGESPSRIIISFSEFNRAEIEKLAVEAGCPINFLGRVGSDRLRMESDGAEVISIQVSELEHAWRSSLKQKLQVEVMAAGAE